MRLCASAIEGRPAAPSQSASAASLPRVWMERSVTGLERIAVGDDLAIRALVDAALGGPELADLFERAPEDRGLARLGLEWLGREGEPSEERHRSEEDESEEAKHRRLSHDAP